jgi:hypothetical protein
MISCLVKSLADFDSIEQRPATEVRKSWWPVFKFDCTWPSIAFWRSLKHPVKVALALSVGSFMVVNRRVSEAMGPHVIWLVIAMCQVLSDTTLSSFKAGVSRYAR